MYEYENQLEDLGRPHHQVFLFLGKGSQILFEIASSRHNSTAIAQFPNLRWLEFFCFQCPWNHNWCGKWEEISEKQNVDMEQRTPFLAHSPKL